MLHHHRVWPGNFQMSDRAQPSRRYSDRRHGNVHRNQKRSFDDLRQTAADRSVKKHCAPNRPARLYRRDRCERGDRQGLQRRKPVLAPPAPANILESLYKERERSKHRSLFYVIFDSQALRVRSFHPYGRQTKPIQTAPFMTEPGQSEKSKARPNLTGIQTGLNFVEKIKPQQNTKLGSAEASVGGEIETLID